MIIMINLINTTIGMKTIYMTIKVIIIITEIYAREYPPIIFNPYLVNSISIKSYGLYMYHSRDNLILKYIQTYVSIITPL